jgi:hypothetical protein
MTWIRTCSAPDLSNLFLPVISNYILNRVFTNRGGHTNPQVQSYIHNFILSTDKALRAYNYGRLLILKYAASNNRMKLLFHALAEFETCISTVNRALLLADRMVKHRDNPEIERTQRRLLDSYKRKIEPIRHVIEHMDKVIAKGEIRDGEPQMLAVSSDGVYLEISSYKLKFMFLASAILQLHTLSMSLASRERSPGNNTV